MRDIASSCMGDLSACDYLETLLVGALLVTFLVEVGL